MKKSFLCLIFALATAMTLTAAAGPAYALPAGHSALTPPLNATEELRAEKLALMSYLALCRSRDDDAAPEAIPVPVLNYHSISDVPIGISILSVTTGNFDKQMKYLLDNGYTPIHLNENPSHYSKPVVITFDDGYADNYFSAYPILKKYNIKATIFIITGTVDTPGYLTTEQIKSMELISFQSHTVSHRLLTTLSEAQIISELWESQIFLTRLTGKHVFALCYPVGKYNDLVMTLTSRYYRCAVTIQSGIGTELLGNYHILRPFVSRNDSIEDFKLDLGLR
jgi:peptidoglycan/xylan/chitin deacetylase (PgdA/CDA1 family)